MLVEVTCAEGERHHVSRGVNVVFEDLRWQGEAGGGGTGEGGEDGENGADVASGGGLVGTVVGIKGLGGFTVKLTTRDALASGPDGASDELSEHDHPLVKGLRSGRALASAVALRPKVRHAHHLATRLPHHLVTHRQITSRLANYSTARLSPRSTLHAAHPNPLPAPYALPLQWDQAKCLSFEPYRIASNRSPTVTGRDATPLAAVPCDWGKSDPTRVKTVHGCWTKGVGAFEAAHKGRLPKSGCDKDAESFAKLLQSALGGGGAGDGDGGGEGEVEIEIDHELAMSFARGCRGALGPVASFVGGTAAQEVLKAVSGVFSPIQQVRSDFVGCGRVWSGVPSSLPLSLVIFLTSRPLPIPTPHILSLSSSISTPPRPSPPLCHTTGVSSAHHVVIGTTGSGR